MIRSIAYSPKAEIRESSTVKYDFSKILQDIPSLNRSVNERVKEYERLRALSIEKAKHIHCCE